MNPEHFQTACELISLWWTCPLVAGALVVVAIWGAEIWERRNVTPWQARDWFILGVFISFTGEILDNLYWAIAWLAHMLQTTSAEAWFHWGCLPNIFFRQACGIAAAAFHLKAINMDSNKARRVFLLFLWSSLFGLLAMGVLAMQFQVELW